MKNKAGDDRKRKIRRPQGKWHSLATTKKKPQIHFKFTLNGADCSLSFLTRKHDMCRPSLGMQC